MDIDLNSEMNSDVLANYYEHMRLIRPITEAREELMWKKFFKWKLIKDYIYHGILGSDSNNVRVSISETDAINILHTVTKEISDCHDFCVLVRHHLGLDIIGDIVIEDENDNYAIERELDRFVRQYGNANVLSDNDIDTCCVEDLFGCVLGETLNNIAYGYGNYSLVNKVATVTNRSSAEITSILKKLAICRALLPGSITKLIETKIPLKKLHKSIQDTPCSSINEWISNDYIPYFESGDYLRTTELEGNDAGRRLIEIYLPQVVNIAEAHIHHGLSLLELIQEGNIGLIQALENYNKYTKFKTFAIPMILHAITHAIKNRTNSVSISNHLIEAINHLHSIQLHFTLNYGRDPTLTEIAEELEITKEEVKELIIVSQLPESLESPIDDDEGIPPKNFIEDIYATSPDYIVPEKFLHEQIEDVLYTLTPREQRVIQLRFGLEDGHGMTLEEVGKVFNVTRERIRQIQDKALRKLRHPSRSRKLKDYLS